jgi:hypothetical protein
MLWTHVAPCARFSRRKVKVGRDYWLLGAFCLAALVSQTHHEQTVCEERRAGAGDVRSLELPLPLPLHCDLTWRGRSFPVQRLCLPGRRYRFWGSQARWAAAIKSDGPHNSGPLKSTVDKDK